MPRPQLDSAPDPKGGLEDGLDDNRDYLDILLRLQGIQSSLQAGLVTDLVVGVGQGGVELDQVTQWAVA